MNLPSDTIAAGTVLTIALTNDSFGNVNSITYSVTDPTGHTSSLAMPLPSYPSTGLPMLVPIEAFQVNVVGPIDDEISTFSSGAGYLTYKVSSGTLTVQSSPSQCPNVYEGWEQDGTGETANTLYGYVTPGPSSTLVQPVTTSFAGALVSNMDTADSVLQVYHLAELSNPNNVNLYEFAFNGGTWTSTDVNTYSAAPIAALGSSIASYENTIYNAPESFYLVPNSAGGEQVEQLWGKTWSPTSLTNAAKAQAAGVGSGLVGFIDTLIGTDNVFHQGTDQHVHVLTWSPGSHWAEDTRIASSPAPAAAFASALSGHMNVESEELFYLGTNQHVYELWRWSRSLDGWHPVDLTEISGAAILPAIGSSLASFYDSAAGADAVFYVGTDQHVHELLFAANTWSSIDATSESGAPLAASGSSLAAHVNTIASSEEVFFVNASQKLEELWSWETAQPAWHAELLPATVLPSVGSPLATDIDSVVSSVHKDELYYVGSDGLVHEMWCSSTNPWSAATP